MNVFLTILKEHPDIVKWLFIPPAMFVSIIMLLIASKYGWFSNIKIGKDGLHWQGKQKEDKERRTKSNNIDHTLRDSIHKLDLELISAAIFRANSLRRSLAITLSQDVRCISTRIALSNCLRYPLYFASMWNNFKEQLRPENTKKYLARIIREMITEYEEFAIEQDMSRCTFDQSVSCPGIPALDGIVDMIHGKLVMEWAIPIRDTTITICNKKIDLYENHIKIFYELGDEERVEITKTRIQKNREYIAALSRKPEAGEI